MPHALIVDDDSSSCEALSEIIAAHGFTSTMANTLREAKIQLSRHRPDLMLLDLSLPDGSGMDLVGDLTGLDSPEIILITGHASVESAVAALRLGAVDYLIKPINLHRLRRLLARVPSSGSARPERGGARTSCSTPVPSGHMLGDSAPMQKLAHQLRRVAPTDATVLELGESGTGKELAARSVHDQSRRKKQIFLPVNCGAISPHLMESEIFGHEKGSFTGAERQHKGYFERATGGTLFLDEITEMPLDLQVKLLRVLESGTFARIGSQAELATDVRIVAATNRDPEQAVAEGKLRLDLYHRLNVFPLRIPALRERGADIPLLAQHFLDALNRQAGATKILSREAMLALQNYHWPGNVRELRNHVHRGFILADRVIEVAGLTSPPTTQPAAGVTMPIPLGTSLAEVDRKIIFATLELCGGVKKRAADILGISLKTLYNRLEEYGREAAPATKTNGSGLITVEGYSMAHARRTAADGMPLRTDGYCGSEGIGDDG
jgi:two-component system response regulator AtoC